MGDTLSLLFLIVASFYDIKDRVVKPELVWSALFAILCMSVVTPVTIVNALLCWAVCFALAWLLDRYRIEFGAGDAKAVALIGGFSGFGIGIASVVIGLSFWLMAEHPKRVAFVPYLLVGFLVTLFIRAKIHIYI